MMYHKKLCGLKAYRIVLFIYSFYSNNNQNPNLFAKPTLQYSSYIMTKFTLSNTHLYYLY